jgi:hypothetical protein
MSIEDDLQDCRGEFGGPDERQYSIWESSIVVFTRNEIQGRDQVESVVIYRIGQCV